MALQQTPEYEGQVVQGPNGQTATAVMDPATGRLRWRISGGQPAQGGGQGYQIQPMITPAEQRQRDQAERQATLDAENLRLRQEAAAREQAEFDREAEEARREQTASADEDAIRQAAQDDIFRRTDTVIDALDQAIEMIDPSTAGVGSLMSGLPGSRARDLQAVLSTIQGNIGLEELQRLRDASSTGASGLGSLTAPELALLTAIRGSIEQGQSPAQLRESLMSIRGQLWEARNTRLQAMGQEPLLDTRSLEGLPEYPEQQVGEGVRNVNGRAMRGDEDLGPWDSYWQSLEEARAQRLRERGLDPEAVADAERRLESAPGALRQFNQGATYGLGDEIDARGAQLETMGSNAVRTLFGQEIPYTSQQAYDAVADANRRGDEQFVERYPVTSLGANILGGIMAPGAGAAGRYVGSADNVLSGLGRGAAVGGGTGFAYGVGTGEGGLVDRAGQAVPEAATGAALGGPLGAVFARSGGPQRAADVERLRQSGVFLTPGMERGGGVEVAENIGARLPIVGSAIRGARERSGESLNRAVWNRSLSNIDQGLPADVNLGQDAVNFTRETIGREFDRAADLVPETTLDDTFNQQIAALRARAASELGGAELETFNRILDNRIARLASGPFSGRTLRQVESEMGSTAADYLTSGDPAQRPLGSLLGETTEALQDVLSRASPEAGQILERARPAWRQFLIGRRASTASGGAPFSPAQLRQAVTTESGGARTGAVATGTAPLSDLARASSVMRDQFGNPGTADVGGWIGLSSLSAADPLSGAVTAGALSAAAVPYHTMGRRIIERLPRNPSPRDVQRVSGELENLIRQAPPEGRTALEELRRNLWAGAANLSGRAGQGSQVLTAQYEDR